MSTCAYASSALRSWVFSLALLPVVVLAASAPGTPQASSPPAAPQSIDDLTEIVVSGTKPTRKSSTILSWMRRLLGQFAYTGYVDLHGKGITEDMRRVQGIGDCVGFGIAPGVQCEIKVTWPESRGPAGEEIFGGISSLSPAMMLFGFEPDDLGIRYMLVDSQGVAEGGLGLLTGDTFMAKEPCAGTPGNCQRIMRIYARPDGKVVQMQIDFEKDAQRVISFTFVMNRIAQAQAQPEEPAKKPPLQARPPLRAPARAPQGPGPGPGGAGGGGRRR